MVIVVPLFSECCRSEVWKFYRNAPVNVNVFYKVNGEPFCTSFL